MLSDADILSDADVSDVYDPCWGVYNWGAPKRGIAVGRVCVPISIGLDNSANRCASKILRSSSDRIFATAAASRCLFALSHAGLTCFVTCGIVHSVV